MMAALTGQNLWKGKVIVMRYRKSVGSKYLRS